MPYADMPSVYAQASCLVLASLPTWFWDEQFGMVLIEALAAGLPVVATTTGAIPEVPSGQGDLFAAGDWIGLAKILEQVRWPVLRASASHPTRISSRTTRAPRQPSGWPKPTIGCSPVDYVVTLRPAELSDEARLLDWRNDPATRAASLSSGEVSSQDHRRWLASKLADSRCALFVILVNSKPLGQVRIDLLDDELAEVSIGLAPEARGRGAGREALRLVAAEAGTGSP